MFCCDKYKYIGCFDTCKCVELGMVAPQDGTYVFEYCYSHSGIGLRQVLEEVKSGDMLRLPFTTNENSAFFFKVKCPDGSYLEQDGVICFAATVSVSRLVGTSSMEVACGALPSGEGNIQLTQILTMPDDSGVLLKIEFASPPSHLFAGFIISIAGYNFVVDENGEFFAPLVSGSYVVDVVVISVDADYPMYTFAFTVV